MTRSLPRIPSLPLFIALGIIVAVLAFGATRLLAGSGGDTLPPLQLDTDASTAQAGALNGSQLFATRAPATVMIESDMGTDTPLTGAGVVVSTDGLIVTASHVVHSYDDNRDAESVTVMFTDDGVSGVSDQVPAHVIARDRYNDLAVLQIDPNATSKPLVAAKLSTSELVPGSDVAEIGQPFGNLWTFTKGTVSNVHCTVASRINATWMIPDAVQFDAPTNPGNSGGPLFDARGEVVGIVQQIDSTTATNTGVSFAISSQIVARTLRLAREGKQDIPYSFTGVRADTLTPQLAKMVGVDATRGAIVQSVDGPAKSAGLSAGSRTVAYGGSPVKTGDVIVAVSGQTITDARQLDRLLGLADPGSLVRLEIVRGSEHRTVQLHPQLAG
jgi:S1-C subfamily serine protease